MFLKKDAEFAFKYVEFEAISTVQREQPIALGLGVHKPLVFFFYIQFFFYFLMRKIALKC